MGVIKYANLLNRVAIDNMLPDRAFQIDWPRVNRVIYSPTQPDPRNRGPTQAEGHPTQSNSIHSKPADLNRPDLIAGSSK